MASLNPLGSNLDLRKAKHLIRRATFKFTKEQLDTFVGMSATNAVNSLTTAAANTLAEPYDPLPIESPDGYWTLSTELPNSLDGQARKRAQVTAWWWHNAMQQTTLKHKLSFFLHTCFPVGKDDGVGAPTYFYDHINFLDFYAFGNLKTIAKKITLDNGMLDYLDNTQNNKNNPNENYAREYLELHTILKGKQIGPNNYTNYTELDIQQAAKVFSGFKKLADRSMIDPDTNIPMGYINIDQHDTSDKTFSSAFGNQIIIGRDTELGAFEELDDFVEMVFAQPETAKAYCRKLYRYFVKSDWTEEIETDIIEPLAQILIANEYEILPVVTTLLSSEHFYDADDSDATDNIIGSIIKSPLQILSEVCAMFELEYPDPSTNALLYYRNFFHNFIHNRYFPASGIEFYNPDSVAGYPAYYQEPGFDRNWFSSNTLIGRYKLIESLIEGKNTITSGDIYAQLDTVAFVKNKIANASDPNLLISEIADLLYPESIDTDRTNYFKSFLVDEGFPDYYWTGVWSQYLNTNEDVTVRTRLNALIIAMVNAAEFQLM
ncbi:hypothetical protein APS56_14160 [Pseudalgibacter alginicilyticus]|uniref:DUF1800 domain-containing protein n=1 Tax=Pseudalgibacter alginicilyticus TaxID=1736674 RepID=A0A0N7HYU2_9FLAO|nr:DUF1800 family protein [Pseudalgibacter alginicilyticus]ALJ06206.1 hypothetical protein APS56_14160 [Pseudalgibacter alginicilyticus]